MSFRGWQFLLGANFDATLDEVQAFLAAAEEAEKPSAA
jgi:hypothetical protein